MLYVRDDAEYDGVTPIKGGIPISWPQFGRGGEFPGSPLGSKPLPENGFAYGLTWEIVDTGMREEEEEPYIVLRAQDNDATRQLWPHEFELMYEVALGERNLTCTLLVRNTGDARFTFTTSLQTHIGVSDATDPAVALLGLAGSPYFNNTEHPTKPRVRVEQAPVAHITGPTENVYVNTQPRVALEVGTGCTVFVENTQGFSDHVVWNPWTNLPSFPNFVSIQPAVAARPIKLQPGEEWSGTCTYFVRDVLLSDKILPLFAKKENPFVIAPRAVTVPELGGQAD